MKKKIEKIEIPEGYSSFLFQTMSADMASIIKLTEKINEIIDALNKQEESK